MVISEQREFLSTIPDEPIMSDKQFRFLSKLAFSYSGIVLPDSKKGMVYARIMKRIRRLKMAGFDDYCGLLRSDIESEIVEFTNAITTNLTAFFREQYHFKYLENVAIEEFKSNNTDRKVRIWSAGCSTGQEAYSLAMCMRNKLKYWDAKILATDLDSRVLAHAKKGFYENLSGVPKAYEKLYCQQTTITPDKTYLMSSDIKDMISFKQLNLLHHWPMTGSFDAIFCRNVLIYFNDETKRELIRRFYSLLKPGGYLFIGHSESLQNFDSNFKLIGQTIYQR